MRTPLALAFVMASLLVAHRAAPQAWPEFQPDERLAFLLGEWCTENRTMHDGVVTASAGTANYRWDLGNAWLLFESRIGGSESGHYEVRGGLSRQPAGGYRAFAYNSLGRLFEYEGAWDGDSRLVFTALRTAPGKGSRVVYEKLASGGIRLVSERQMPDGHYAAYFEATLHRGAIP